MSARYPCPVQTAPKVGTIGDLLRERRALYLCCGNVRSVRSAAVDLAAPAGKEGAELSLQRLIEWAVCRRLDDGLKAWTQYWQLLGERRMTGVSAERAA
jgi:hypothetical protein